MESRHGDNLYIHGPPGSGKQATMSHILSRVSKDTQKVIPVYVDCAIHTTQMGVYGQILKSINLSIPRMGWAADEVFARICERIDQEGISILLVLDKFHGLSLKRDESLFYSIAKANDNPKARFGLISISRDLRALERISEQIRTRLGFTILEFKEYTGEQLCDILQERAKIALADGTCPMEVLEACAMVGQFNHGDARLALDTLRKAARHAERRNSRKIERMDVDAVAYPITFAKIGWESPQTTLNGGEYKLSDMEKLAMNILARNGELTSSLFYREFSAKVNMSKREIRKFVGTLEAKGIVKSSPVARKGILNGKKIQLLLRR